MRYCFKRLGLSLTEMLFVITIFGVLSLLMMTVILPRINSGEDELESTLNKSVKDIHAALGTFETENGLMPIALGPTNVFETTLNTRTVAAPANCNVNAGETHYRLFPSDVVVAGVRSTWDITRDYDPNRPGNQAGDVVCIALQGPDSEAEEIRYIPLIRKSPYILDDLLGTAEPVLPPATPGGNPSPQLVNHGTPGSTTVDTSGGVTGGGGEDPTGEDTTDVALGDEESLPPSVTGDPHVVDDDGGSFDFMGRPDHVFAMLSDSNVQINTRFKRWTHHDDATTLGDVGIQVGSAETGITRVIYMQRPDSLPLIIRPDGQRLVLNYHEGVVFDTGFVSDAGEPVLGHAWFSVDRLEVGTGEYTLLFHLEDGMMELERLQINERGVFSDHVRPQGYLGEVLGNGKPDFGRTGHGAQGEGALKGTVDDYLVQEDTLLGTHFAYSVFQASVTDVALLNKIKRPH